MLKKKNRLKVKQIMMLRYSGEVELDPSLLLLFDQLGKSLRAKVKAMGKRMGSSESVDTQDWHLKRRAMTQYKRASTFVHYFCLCKIFPVSSPFPLQLVPPEPSPPPGLVCPALAPAGVKLPQCLFCFVFSTFSSSPPPSPLFLGVVNLKEP